MHLSLNLIVSLISGASSYASSLASSGAFLGHHLGYAWGIIWGIIFGMSGASSGACLWHHLKACLGQSKISAVLHASLMPFFGMIFGCWSHYDLCLCNFHLSTEQLEPSTVNKRPKVVEKVAHGADVQLIVEIFTPSHPEI